MRVLHAGCGGGILPEEMFPGAKEVRLDIDPGVKPDIVASLTNMGDIGEFDALYTSHCLEHLYPDEVPVALAEFLRVLTPKGIAVIVVPDLEDLTLSDRVLYETLDAGPVTTFDVIYGHRRSVASNKYMAHHSGFTKKLLTNVMKESGFGAVIVRREGDFNLWAIGVKNVEG